MFGIPNLLKEKKGGSSKRRGTFGAERVRANLTARVNLAERPARQLEQRCAGKLLRDLCQSSLRPRDGPQNKHSLLKERNNSNEYQLPVIKPEGSRLF